MGTIGIGGYIVSSVANFTQGMSSSVSTPK
jgi:hypothetical protein